MAKMVDAEKMIADTLRMRDMMDVDAISIDGIIKYLQENAVEAETVNEKHSGWDALYNGWYRDWIYSCRLCGARSHCMDDYCPNCGARMDGGTRYEDG